MRTQAAVVIAANKPFELHEVELDELREHEVLVEIVATGMCHTDLSAASGSIPFPLPGVLGHEGAGRVLQVGANVERTKVGDAALLTFTSCGNCRSCRAGHPAHCDYHLPWNLLGGRRADGSSTVRWSEGPLNAHFFGQSSFARHAVVDERSILPLPASTTDAELVQLAPLGCGLQTGAGTVLNLLRPATDAALVVTGAGAVGLAAVMAASAVSVESIVVVDAVASRLELARELGATDVVDARTEDVSARLAAVGDGRGPDAVIETTGNLKVLETAVDALAIGGTCAVIGAPPAGSRASFDVNRHLPGRRIVGVTLGDSEPERFLPQLLALHRSGRFPFERLERTFAFDDINAAADAARNGEVVKAVLMMKSS